MHTKMRFLLISMTLLTAAHSVDAENWSILLPDGHPSDAAIRAAVEDLQSAGSPYGVKFELGGNGPNRIQVESPSSDDLAPQGFEMGSSIDDNGNRTVTLRGGSIEGEINALYWIWDRLRVYGEIPDLNTRREPALKVRFTGGDDQNSIRNALRYTATWVTGADTLQLFPWDGIEPEDTENRKYREATQKWVDLAHSYHMKFIPRCDEFTYLDEYLKQMDATLTPEDPNLWKALQEKYRRLFKAMPGLDGVCIRTGELTRVFGNYRPFDIIHEPRDLDWSLEKRYRTFVQKMYEVVVGEFDKIYYQRTWETSAREHHSDPEIFKKTFTEEVPTKNLYLSPYMSLADRWYYQPYNPTFNLTDHNMVVLLATLDYHAHAGIDVFPSFPGQYHQGGLQQILSDSDSNLVGAQFGVPQADSWSTRDLTGYTCFRLAWDPNEDLWQIAHDFAAIVLGQESADEMAEAILLSYTAYKDGIYVKPVAEGIQGNTLPHLRIGTFPVRGVPEIDGGREHIEWLDRTIYQPCKDRIEETLDHLSQGLEAARQIETITKSAAPNMKEDQRKAAVDSSVLSRWLVEVNVGYIQTCLAYFQYREDPTVEKKDHLASILKSLKSSRQKLIDSPGFQFKLFGVDQLIANTDEILADREKAEQALKRAPESDRVFELIAEQQKAHADYLNKHREELLPILHWKGRIDGRDVLLIHEDQVSIDHLQGDGPAEELSDLVNPLPEEEVTLVVEDLGSAPYRPFVLEQPNKTNGYTGKIFLFDRDPSYSRWEFKVYAVGKKPKETGL
ncbi:MAG: hypothetical protein KC964_10300, partial [Candidatus Omnitrophica bacterium]|nr:hypothetical protein [Candidatus Omnitrophota bacterium]